MMFMSDEERRRLPIAKSAPKWYHGVLYNRLFRAVRWRLYGKRAYWKRVKRAERDRS